MFGKSQRQTFMEKSYPYSTKQTNIPEQLTKSEPKSKFETDSNEIYNDIELKKIPEDIRDDVIEMILEKVEGRVQEELKRLREELLT